MNLQQNQRTQEAEYNIDNYTDAELLDILDLNNPTDRELEAKIIFLIRKYQNMQTIAATQLSNFFEKIYARFFEIEEEEKEDEEKEDEEKSNIEGFDGNTTVLNPDGTPISNQDMDNVNLTIVNSQPSTSITGNNYSIMMPTTEQNQNKTSTINTLYTKTLEYTPGKLNPLVQQTTRRVISIDSQYRDDKTSLSTEFTFNLTETLKDVVSLKLYSIQIPYTWYTVNDSFGSNFFYIKGATPGINNGNHDIKIEIPAGNYGPNDLTNKLLSSINTVKQNIYTDINFGTTRISYDNNTAKSTLTLDITNIYNENSYYLEFPYWSTPYNLSDASRCTTNPSIPGFLGFEQQQYYPNTLYSDKRQFETLDNNTTYDLNINNTYFTVIKYIGPGNYVDISNNPSIIDLSFNIYVSTNGGRRTGSNGGGIGTITQSELYTDLNEQIKKNPYLSNESGIENKAILVDPSNILTKYWYELKIKPNRKTTNNIQNSKIFIQFPTETGSSTIWTKTNTLTNSCFGFARTLNDINNIYGETQTVEQTDVYTISGTYIDLICVHPNFNVSENNIRIDISSNTYASLVLYMRAINNGFDTAYKRTDTTKTPITDAILNVPDLTTYTYNANGPNTPTGTYAYIDSNNYFNIYLDINKKFDETMYTVDFTDSVLNTSNAPLGLGGLYNCTTTGQTFTITTTASIVSGIFIQGNSLIAKIIPRTGINNGNQSDITYEIRSSPSDLRLYNNTSIVQTINGYFANYIDTSTNIRIFSGITLSDAITTTNNTTFTLTININKVLTASSYNIQFIEDNIGENSWNNYLNIDPSMVDLSMNLQVPSGQTSINSALYDYPIITKNNNNVTITSQEPLPQSNQIIIQTGINDTIKIKPYEDGVNDNTNIVTITIPPKNYTRDLLISTINTLITQSISTYTDITQSTLSTYTNSGKTYVYFRMNVTRTYTAKDYNLVFYDPFSFVKCYAGVTSVRNTTWDGTIGWILGFHLYTVYYLSALESTNNIITITGDTVVNTNLYNYFMLCLDDYNQSHLNDGLVTISAVDTTVPLPTYANKDNFYCNPTTGQKVYNTTENVNYSQLTQNQLYSITQIANSKNNTSNITGPSTGKSYGVGPFVKDVFGLIPLKLTGLSPGQSFIEYGGTLQNQDRTYFGPVNIRRMSVKIVSDRGDVVNLNGADWSFSLLCDSLNNLNPSSSK